MDIKTTKISAILNDWPSEDLENLLEILDPKGRLTRDFEGSILEKTLDAFRWRYHSPEKAKVFNTVGKLFHEKKFSMDEKERYHLPSYDKLLLQASRKTKCFVQEATTEDRESYLIEAVLLAALSAMEPTERHRVFSETFQMEAVAKDAKIKDNKHVGPITAFGALGMAQASGFGVYLAATTTLGFLTHAVGISLPFAAYTGLTSTIAFVIGPVGWLGVGIWSAFAFTGPKWDRIIPALIYIIQVRHRPK
jgi:uncharacterized protein YaaW (UPF0174 family)